MNDKLIRRLRNPLAVVLFVGVLAGGSVLRAEPDKTLPDFVVRELRHLEETYRILDITAEKVWSGWTTYRDVPFLLKYPNDLQVLIGHPNPPAPFEKVPGLAVEGKDVYADFSRISTAGVAYPLIAGGGPLPFGTDKDGNPLMTVHMNFMSTDILKKGGYGIVPMPFCVELQILCYIHELFHCFQPGRVQTERVGNLMINPDAAYALYSTIEGKALVNAYRTAEAKEAEAFIRDFLAARMLKRKLGVPEMQRKQESMDDVMEGTAVYSEVRTLEILSEGFTTKMDLSKDPYYSGFRNAKALLAAHLEQLGRSAEVIYDVKGKCYDYGCYQALLLQRYEPAWQAAFSRGPSTLDGQLAERFPVEEKDLPVYEQRFRELYGFEAIKARSDAAIKERDDAYRSLKDRRGKVYIVSFKEIGAYESQLLPDASPYALGLIHMHMKGLPAIRLDQTELSAVSVPVEGNQLHYLKIVDTAPKAGNPAYTVSGRSQGNSVYADAVITTPLFTLKTPLVRVEESKGRIKFIVLPVLQR
jgi:hypothetical protein